MISGPEQIPKTVSWIICTLFISRCPIKAETIVLYRATIPDDACNFLRSLINQRLIDQFSSPAEASGRISLENLINNMQNAACMRPLTIKERTHGRHERKADRTFANERPYAFRTFKSPPRRIL